MNQPWKDLDQDRETYIYSVLASFFSVKTLEPATILVDENDEEFGKDKG